jgi:hypothetical protein
VIRRELFPLRLLTRDERRISRAIREDREKSGELNSVTGTLFGMHQDYFSIDFTAVPIFARKIS